MLYEVNKKTTTIVSKTFNKFNVTIKGNDDNNNYMKHRPQLSTISPQEIITITETTIYNLTNEYAPGYCSLWKYAGLEGVGMGQT